MHQAENRIYNIPLNRKSSEEKITKNGSEKFMNEAILKVIN